MHRERDQYEKACSSRLLRQLDELQHVGNKHTRAEIVSEDTRGIAQQFAGEDPKQPPTLPCT
eukprot:7595322-Prorocentrum_lima.AAC.1